MTTATRIIQPDIAQYHRPAPVPVQHLQSASADYISANAGMQAPDVDQALNTKKNLPMLFIEMLFRRIQSMFALRPVMGNIIGLLLALGGLFVVNHFLAQTHLGKYHVYFGIGLQLAAALQIIYSGARSLTLPVVAVGVGIVVSHQLVGQATLFGFNGTFFQNLMAVGVIGLIVSVISIR